MEPCKYHTQHFIRQSLELEHLLPYEYEQLTTPTALRLFTLHGGHEGSPIRGVISTTLDASTAKFNALSYTWGSSLACHLIECSDRKLWVNCHLFSALNRLRHDREDSVWFIDFISINQSDAREWLQERASQVRRMGIIFSTASKVIADLGEAPDGMETVLALMKRCCEVTYDDASKRSKTLHKLHLPPFTLDVWATFAGICERPWFRRVWVLQEYALASMAAFLIGREYYPSELVVWSIIRAAHIAGITRKENLTEMLVIRGRIGEFLRAACALDHLSLRLTAPRSWSLIEILQLSQDLKATDSRDRVYALLGLARANDTSEFRIDYEESVDALSCRLSMLALQKGELIPLFYTLSCQYAEGHPSWMIDLRQYRTAPGLDRVFFGRKNSGCRWYNAGGRHTIDFRVEDGSHLIVKGMIVDTLQSVATPYPQDVGDDTHDPLRNRQIIGHWIVTAMKFAFDEFIYHHEDHRQSTQDFWLAMTAGGHDDKGYFGLDSKHLTLLSDRTRKRIATLWREPKRRAAYDRMGDLAMLSCEGKNLAITKTRDICLVPAAALPDDSIAVLRGFPTPFLLRSTREVQGGYRLLGSVYLGRVMNNECPDTHQDILLC